MSKVGKKTIVVPDGVEIIVEEQEVIVKGPLGELKQELPRFLELRFDDGRKSFQVQFKEGRESKDRMRFWGLIRSLIKNMVIGVKEGYSKELEIQGIGFRANLKGEDLELQVGYSHPVIYPIPPGVKVSVTKEIIKVEGIDKQLVGQAAANIKRIKKPDSYKGKGIRYKGEEIRIKAGKQAVGESA